MDPSYSINMNGFIYTPLSVEGFIASSSSPITSWPSYDGTLGYLASQADYPNYTRPQQQLQQQGDNSQHNIGLTIDHPDHNEQGPMSSFASSSLLSHISSSVTSTSPSSATSSRHPLDLSPINTKNLSISSMDLLQSSSVPLHSASADAFGLNTNNLSPFHNNQSSATLSRSSSSTSSGCIDPAALMLKHDPPPLAAHGTSIFSSSSCSSTPESRRLSSFSLSGGLDEDMTFSDAITAYETVRKNCSSSLNQCGPSTPDPSESWQGCSVYAPGLLLADGTLLRFDGRSLVPAQLSTGPPIDFTVTDESFVPLRGEDDCQQLITMMNSNADLSLMMPSYMPYNEFSQLGIGVVGQGSPSTLTDPTLSSDSSLCLSQLSMSSMTLGLPPPSSTSSSSALPSTNSPQFLKHKKMTSLRKSAFEDRRRRGSTDSAYHSSSSSSSSSSNATKFRASSSSISGRFDSNNKNNNNSTSSSNRYRKDGVGEFQCPFEGCDYHYNLRRELNRHRNVHVFAGRDKYRCMNCNSGLCRLDSVKRHMEAKGKSECLKRGLYQEFREDGELARVRHCKPSWYEGAAAVVAAAAAASAAALESRRRRK